MSSTLRLVIIGLLILSIGVWVGLSQPSTQAPAVACDASLGWCSDADKNLQLQVSQANNKGTDLIQIDLEGVAAAQVSGRISGENMYMGQFNVNFKRNQQGQLQAITSLPNCVENHTMIWRLDINQAPNQNQTFLFSSPTH